VFHVLLHSVIVVYSSLVKTPMLSADLSWSHQFFIIFLQLLTSQIFLLKSLPLRRVLLRKL
jgi:hypothetical protein